MRNSAGPAGVFESEYRPDSAAPASNAPLGQTALSLSPRPTAGPGRGVGSTEPRVLRLRSTASHAAGAALARPGSEERGWSLLPAPRSPLAEAHTGCRPRILQGLPPGCVSYLVTLMLRAFCVTLFSAAQRPVHCGVLNEVPGLPLVGSSSGLYMVAILIPSYLQPPLALTLPSTQ